MGKDKVQPSAAHDFSLVRTSRTRHWDGRWLANYTINANRRAAEMGIPEAQNEMGVRFYVGSLVERNPDAALDWFGKAAAQGYADACYNLGICHAYGQQNEINYSVAGDCFKWAANLGSVEAASLLVERHASGKWLEKDVHEVAKWFRVLCRRDTKALEFKRPVSPECQDDPERYGYQCYWLDIAAEAGVKEAQYFKARSDYDSVSHQRTIKGNEIFAEKFDRSARRAVALFRSSSESGFLPSLQCLGDCYRTAFGVEKNIPEAVRLYRLAAEKGYAPAQNALADAFFHGVAGKKDLQQAIELYEKAAAQGNAQAQYSLGMCYLTGVAVKKDMGKAWMLLTRAAHGRVEDAYEMREYVESLVTSQERAKWDEGRRMNPFSKLYTQEEFREWLYHNNYPAGFVTHCSRQYDWRKLVADLGNAKALCDIGVDLAEKPTSDGDLVRAFELFSRAANHGEPSAFFNVGKCLMDGIGVAVDKPRGLVWIEKACASGYKSVQPLLADCYFDGIGCETNAENAIDLYKQNMLTPDYRPKQAFLGMKCRKSEDGSISYCFSPARRWFELMAYEGDAESQYEMGREMSNRSNQWQKEKESQEAFSWFLEAAKQGHAKAENELGECYRDGHGVKPDMSEAVRWFEKAAEQNNPESLFNLGFQYYSGNGVRRDWKKARELLERAVEADKHGWLVRSKAKGCLRNMGVNVLFSSGLERETLEAGQDEGESWWEGFDPPADVAPADSPRPDGLPWLTKEQILDKLDNTLCLVDKARVQRTFEEDANKCMLCWLGEIIGEEIVINDRKDIAHDPWHPCFVWTEYRNPHFPPGKGTLLCGSRKCDYPTMGKGYNRNSWREKASQQSEGHAGPLFLDGGPRREDGAYDLALEYWKRITRQPWIEIPDEPALLPPDASERWVLFEKGSDGRYNDIVFLPPAMSHLEWEKKYLGETLGGYVKKHVDEFSHRWVIGIDAQTECDLNGLELDRKFGKPNRVKDAPRSYRIWIQHEDGSREQVPRVYFPDLDVWKKKRIGEWIAIGKRIDFWLALEDAGHIDKDQTREMQFRKLSEQIREYVDDIGPEPDDDIDLTEAIPESEQQIIDQTIDQVLKEVARDFMKMTFGTKNHGAASIKQQKD